MDFKNNSDIIKFVEFLKQHEVKEQGTDCSHTTLGTMFGLPWSKYNIKNEDMETFLDLYGTVVSLQNKHKFTLHIVERPEYNCPIMVDLDFRQKEETRNYTLETVKYISKIYIDLIKKYVNVDTDNINAFVFEKPKPSFDDKQSNYKDGFHIMFPEIVIGAPLRYKILEEVQHIVTKNDGLKIINNTNSLEEIFDKSIVLRNGWMMYGSNKFRSQKYVLTHIYEDTLNELDISEYSDGELAKLLSIRNQDANLLELSQEFDTAEFKDELNIVYSKYHGNKKPVKSVNSNHQNINSETVLANFKEKLDNRDKYMSKENRLKQDKNFEMAQRLTRILSIKRSEEYAKWIQVGWALYNIDVRLFDSFVEFSKMSKKYVDGCCNKVWDKSRGEGYTIASLHWWAKEDNPEEYMKLLRDNIKDIIKEAENGNHDDIAKVVYELYKHSFVCSSIKKNIWYEFQDNRWVPVECGYTLMNKFSDEITGEFLKLGELFMHEAIALQGEERDKKISKSKSIFKIIDKLKNIAFKNQLLSACSHKFYDSKFETKLDDCPYLLGFDNGVYDLKNQCFRNGVPDDYITLNVGYPYEEFSMDHPKVMEIEGFFSKIQIDKDMKLYILTLIASYLDGRNKDQKFILWTGNGSNGKSTIMDLIRYTFGEYFGVLPVTVLTKKRAGAGNATPELADKRGKRFLAIQEPEHDDMIYVGFMKELSGNDWIQARALYGDPFMYKPQFKLVLTCNKLPNIPSSDGGVWRRLRVSPFSSKFVDNPKAANEFPKDRELTERLESWNRAFVWLLLNKYYPLYVKSGIIEPPLVTSFTDKYKKDVDMYWEFLLNNVEITKLDTDSENVAGLYVSFKSWYNESHTKNKNCPDRKQFINYLEEAGYKMENGKVFGMKYAPVATNN